jgi:hypothetical protein
MVDGRRTYRMQQYEPSREGGKHQQREQELLKTRGCD